MKLAVKQSIIVLLLLTLSIVMTANAQAQINASNKTGKVTFEGEHVGMTFKGVFEKWQATITLPPSAQASIQAVFDLASAKTGDSTYDSTLPEGDWFDVKNHPKGYFESSSITYNDNEYKVVGTLTLKGVALPIHFVLVDDNNTLRANFVIDRINYSIGLDSDPDAEWVSRDISLGLSIKK